MTPTAATHGFTSPPSSILPTPSTPIQTPPSVHTQIPKQPFPIASHPPTLPPPTMPPKPKLNVHSFPRPPLCERTPRHLQIKWRNQIIADTKDAYWVLETTHPPSILAPPSTFRQWLIIGPPPPPSILPPPALPSPPPPPFLPRLLLRMERPGHLPPHR